VRLAIRTKRRIHNSKFVVGAVQVQTLIRRLNSRYVDIHNRGKTPCESTCFPLVSQMYVFTLAEEAPYLKRNGAASVSTRQELPGYRVACALHFCPPPVLQYFGTPTTRSSLPALSSRQISYRSYILSIIYFALVTSHRLHTSISPTSLWPCV
jgi:hypothetical protein